MAWRQGRCRGGGAVLVLVLVLVLCGSAGTAGAASAVPTLTIHTDEPASAAPFMGLGVEVDPYDSFSPTALQWSLIFQRLDYMRPGFIRVVEPASDYFGGYDSAHNPVYRWTASHVLQLRTILDYAKSRGITVVLGDWSNPLINHDPRVPAEFLQQLHDVYGYTDIAYYNVMNEPNDAGPSCGFGCWTGVMRALSGEFASLGLNTWLQLIGPDNANSWDDTAAAQSLDRTSGLDTDNPIGGDSWVTATLHAIPAVIGAYDSHRYATIWGVEHGVYGDQMRARREQISNLDSAAKPYFAGEVGTTARQVSPFSAFPPGTLQPLRAVPPALAPLIDPSARPRASTFVDSQPHIAEFGYGVWMSDMMVQAISAGMSGASAWDLDDAMHVGGQYGSRNLKRWGFWNSLGGQDGYPASDLQLRPWFYTWSVLARSFPAGAQPLLTPAPSVSGVRIAAARVPSSGRYDLSFAIVNDSDTPRTIMLSVPSAQAPLTLARYDYFAAAPPVDASGFPAPAQVLHDVRLASGLTVQLPSRGVAVLTSVGLSAPIDLSDGPRALLDTLSDWRQVYAHTRGLKLDRGDPSHDNGDGSRASLTAKAKKAQYLIYRASQISSFELKAYYGKRLDLAAYRSPDGRTWTAVPLESTNPAPAIGGRSFLAEVLPNEPIPAGTNWLKIALTGKGTELGEVALQAGRSGPACLARSVAARAGSLAGIPLGAGPRAVGGRFGVPTARSAHTRSYCVIGGGEVVVVFSGRSGASLIVSTARSYRPAGVGPGTTVAKLTRRLARSGLRTVAAGIMLATVAHREIVFAIRSGRVQAVALAAPVLVNSARGLAHAVRLAVREVSLAG